MSWFHQLRDDLSSLHMYWSLILSGQDVSREAVRDRRLPPERTRGFALEESGDVGGLLATAQENYQTSLRQQSALAGRGTLMLAVALLAIFLGGLWVVSQGGPMWMRLLFAVAGLLLVNSVVLLLGVSSTEPDASPGLAQSEVPLDPVNLKKSWINTYVVEQAKVVGRTQYLTRLLAAARAFAIAGFVLLGGLVIAGAVTAPKADRASLAESIKNDPTLAELLRGPRGERGEKGDRGLIGLAGPPGKQGPPGADITQAKKNSEATGETILIPQPAAPQIITVTKPPILPPILPPPLLPPKKESK